MDAESAGEWELPRKRLRVGVVSERGAVNAVRALLERHSFVVSEWDARSDYGRDLFIDLTDAGELTGTVIAAQVKGGRSHFWRGTATISARLSDIRFWSESTVPVVGIVWDPDDGSMWWVDLTLRSRELAVRFRDERPARGHVERIAVTNPLDELTVHAMIDAVKDNAPGYAEDAFLKLFDDDDVVRSDGVIACWTFARRDPRSLTLLRRALPRLRGRSFLDALTVFGMYVGHPDIWYPRGFDVDRRPKDMPALLDWSGEEVAAMIHEHERLVGDDDQWRRGGTGQTLWHVLHPLGRTGPVPFEEALRIAVHRRQFDAAFRILVGVAAWADDPWTALGDALRTYPALDGRSDVAMLLQHIADVGTIEPYD
ncbi:DUF4365 domain-containing protein [Curtobacterium sp. 20TX0008]|uniref:DUF4365 domain-containing protein n=1 Tax=Curtobacterium sp. 20TX0008 TaxID=3022018 RepID=UPI00232CAE8A|nr:DUF4365 domain-containing protein [Curtobacterium sp. 20TX0008]MDB6427094.1 DUF4365 domain-containing protein [Curtobacterium sp. 20TX0008]